MSFITSLSSSTSLSFLLLYLFLILRQFFYIFLSLFHSSLSAPVAATEGYLRFTDTKADILTTKRYIEGWNDICSI